MICQRPNIELQPTNPSKVFFLVLSPGIRNCIYGQLLHFPYLELAGKSARKKNGYAWNYHMRFYKYEVKPALKLLRTCKQINREGSSIFYGENEFRFSATYGSYILLSFCRTIGKANTARLTTITMHAPFGGCNESKDTGPQVSGNALSNFRWLSRNIMGLHEEGYAAGKFNIPRTLSNTSISAGLQTLRLVVPDTMRFVPFDKDLRNIGCEFELYDHLSQLKMQQLKVELVFLDSLDDPPFLDWEETKGDADLIAYCRSKAWEVRCMAYDDRGRYDVSEQLLAGEGEEAVEEIVDEMM